MEPGKEMIKCLMCVIGCTCGGKAGAFPECPWCQADREAQYRHRIEVNIIKYIDKLEKVEADKKTKQMQQLQRWAQECLHTYDKEMDIDYERAIVVTNMIKELRAAVS